MIEIPSLNQEYQLQDQTYHIDVNCDDTQIPTCPICYNDCSSFRYFVCKHHVCEQCFNEWFIQRQNTDCCICRTVVVRHETDDNLHDITVNENVYRRSVMNRLSVNGCIFFYKVNLVYFIICGISSLIIEHHLNIYLIPVFTLIYLLLVLPIFCISMFVLEN